MLALQLAKFADWRKGTARDAGAAWWPILFQGVGEVADVAQPPTAYFALK